MTIKWLPEIAKSHSRPLVLAATALAGALTPLAVMMVVGNSVTRWVAVSSYASTTYYADPATIATTGSVVRIWVVSDYKVAHLIANGKPYMSKKMHMEWDCSTKEVRMLSSSFHGGNMGTGEAITTDSAPSEKWGIVPSNTAAEKLWRFACTKR